MTDEDDDDEWPNIYFVDLRRCGVPLSRRQIWRKVERGEFPPPHKPSDRTSSWYRREIREYHAKQDAKYRRT